MLLQAVGGTTDLSAFVDGDGLDAGVRDITEGVGDPPVEDAAVVHDHPTGVQGAGAAGSVEAVQEQGPGVDRGGARVVAPVREGERTGAVLHQATRAADVAREGAIARLIQRERAAPQLDGAACSRQLAHGMAEAVEVEQAAVDDQIAAGREPAGSGKEERAGVHLRDAGIGELVGERLLAGSLRLGEGTLSLDHPGERAVASVAQRQGGVVAEVDHRVGRRPGAMPQQTDRDIASDIQRRAGIHAHIGRDVEAPVRAVQLERAAAEDIVAEIALGTGEGLLPGAGLFDPQVPIDRA